MKRQCLYNYSFYDKKTNTLYVTLPNKLLESRDFIPVCFDKEQSGALIVMEEGVPFATNYSPYVGKMVLEASSKIAEDLIK